MVAAARGRGIEARLTDVADWMPSADTDVVVSNAVLQWVPTHRELLPRWIAALPSGAWFGMQVPGNFAAPSHALVRELAAEQGLRGSAGVVLRDADVVAEPAGYAELLAGAGAEVDVWETTYLHRLTGDDPVLRWISGSALGPVRDALSAAEYDRFEAALAPRLRAAYPVSADGSTWFPFRRIFAVVRVGQPS
jgi:trans-aconitate 2-methyltransferase